MRLLFLCALLTPGALYANAEWDLKTVENFAVDANYGIKADKAGIRAAHEGVVQKYSEILPTIDLDVGMQRYTLPDSAIVVKQNFVYPTQWYKERKVLKLTEQIASKTLNLDRQTLLNSIRKQYYRVQFLEKKKDLTLKSFIYVEQFKRESDKRFSQGFISEPESKRAALQLLEFERSLQEVTNELDSARKQLLSSLNQKESLFTLKSDLSIGDSFLKKSEGDFRKYIAENSSESLAIAKLQSDTARLKSDSYFYKYLPAFSAEARFPMNKEENEPVYKATLTWNIFTGGSDRAEHRRIIALKEQAEYTRRDTLTTFSTDSEKSLETLLDGKVSYVKQKEGLGMWERIVASSQLRFQRGNISSKDLSDDISSYLKFSTDYYQSTYDLISNISDFCLFVGKDELFYELMAL